MDVAAGTIGKPASSVRRLGIALANLSDSRLWAYYLLVPSLLLISRWSSIRRSGASGLSFREMRLNRLDLGTGFVGLKHYSGDRR